MEVLFTVLMTGLMLGAIYSLVGVSFGMVYWTTGVFHLAIAGIYTFSGYVAWQVTVGYNMGVFAGAAVGLAVAIILGLVMEQFVYYPLGQRGIPLLLFVASLGMFTVIQAIVAYIWQQCGGVFVIPLFRKMLITGVNLLSVITILTTCIVLLGFDLFLARTKMGKAIRAVASDVDMARVVGIKVRRVRLVVFAWASGLTGLAVLFQAWRSGMNFTVGFPILLVSCVAVMIPKAGDLRSLAVLGVVLGVLQSFVAWVWGAHWQNFVTLMIFLLVLVFRTVKLRLPSRLFGDSGDAGETKNAAEV
jgi:branched-subunit amino acid ABC-type transport system permease component